MTLINGGWWSKPRRERKVGAEQAKPSFEFWILSYGQWKKLKNFLYNLQSPGLITALCHWWCQLREVKVGLLSLTPNKGCSRVNVSGPLLQVKREGLNVVMQSLHEHSHWQSINILDTANGIKPLTC